MLICVSVLKDFYYSDPQHKPNIPECAHYINSKLAKYEQLINYN